jgi:acetoacetate decarboxylase
MARLRYVKTPEQIRKAAEANPEFLSSTIRSVRARYETDAAVAAAVLPRPLEPAARPEVSLVVSEVAMQITPDFTFTIGAASFGVLCRYEGVAGAYLLTMPMTTEAAVVGGRETYGEPKKIAEIRLTHADGRVSATVTRMGVTYIELSGAVGAALGPRAFTDHAYCFKALPSIEKGKGFDGEPLLVRLDWQHAHETVARVDGEVILRESPFDPVADVPVRRLLTMEYEEGSTVSSGTVLRSVPGAWLLPFFHARYDDLSGDGLELPGSGPTHA